jgi:hypothetical protein
VMAAEAIADVPPVAHFTFTVFDLGVARAG